MNPLQLAGLRLQALRRNNSIGRLPNRRQGEQCSTEAELLAATATVKELIW